MITHNGTKKVQLLLVCTSSLRRRLVSVIQAFAAPYWDLPRATAQTCTR